MSKQNAQAQGEESTRHRRKEIPRAAARKDGTKKAARGRVRETPRDTEKDTAKEAKLRALEKVDTEEKTRDRKAARRVTASNRITQARATTGSSMDIDIDQTDTASTNVANLLLQSSGGSGSSINIDQCASGC